MSRGPLRRVVEIRSIQHMTRPSISSKGRPIPARPYTTEVEVLECGHIRIPKENSHFGGTDLGDRDRRHCAECASSR